ncbi:uncharacterized protein KIAA1841 isoform X2 [Nilaparvata lugens]|uniref:uncharacterized protein KIAA1841 isoform X2 n=1 Tax=Nilaparvata lugens TaxID=108931 RepID=UPI00193D6FB4|nr:uncharacterized protein KIAA1841 isoform X2 [Nilaparvata lugens]
MKSYWRLVHAKNEKISQHEINELDTYKSQLFQLTPSPEMAEPSAKDYDNKSFSIKVELTLKSSKSSLNAAEKCEVVEPEYEAVQTNKSDSINSNLKLGRTTLEKNRVESKNLSESRTRRIGRINTMRSDNVIEKNQQVNTIVSHLSDSELNKKQGMNNIPLVKSNQQPKEILTGIKKVSGSGVRVKKRNLAIEKGKKMSLTPPIASFDDDIEINVYNNKKVLKKYKFSSNLLISKSGYFTQVSSTKNLNDFKITVYSDHDIFKWILLWIKFESSKLKSAKPELNCLNVTPLLISASVFQITSLMEYCLNFYIYNLNDIIKYTTDFGNLDNEVITRLAGMLSNVELSRVQDESDKIISRLYCEMIMSLAQSKPEPSRGHFVTFSLVYKCTICNKIILKEHSNNINCLPEQHGIDYKGNVIINHKIDTGWNITKYVKNLMKKYGSWEMVYWNMWAECHFLKCNRCNGYYSVKYSKQCVTHTKNIIYKSLSNNVVSPEGIYPCCGAKVYKFDIGLLQKYNGCKNISHSPSLEVDRSYSDIQKIYKSMKSIISTRVDKVKSNTHENPTKLIKKSRVLPNNLINLQSQTESQGVGLLDKNLLKVKSYKSSPVKGWQDCQESKTGPSCFRVSSEESVSDYSVAQDKQQKRRSLCPRTGRKLTSKDVGTLDLTSSRGLDEGDSSTSLSVEEEPKVVQRYKKEQETVLQSILESGLISVKTVDKIERKLKKSLNEIKSSLKMNQDNLRDYEDRLNAEVNSLLCQRTNSTSACLLDSFPHVNLRTVVKNNTIQSSVFEIGDRSTNVHSSDSEISVGSSVKTYCSTISSSTRIYHSRTSNVWNSFEPLAGSFVRVEAEWQDTFNANMPPRTKAGKKQDDSVYINCLDVRALSIMDNKREISRRKTSKTKSVSGNSMRRSWKALAPKSKISEIESYLSTTVLPTRQHSLVNTTNVAASKMDQLMTPPCEGKHNMAFTCGFTSLVNYDSLNARNITKESDYVNPIWIYDKRYKELDYLSCIYMPIPFQKDYDAVKGVDWQRLRILEHEWKSFLKFMKVDENFERSFHHSAIKPYYNTYRIEKKRKNR